MAPLFLAFASRTGLAVLGVLLDELDDHAGDVSLRRVFDTFQAGARVHLHDDGTVSRAQ